MGVQLRGGGVRAGAHPREDWLGVASILEESKACDGVDEDEVCVPTGARRALHPLFDALERSR